MNSELFDLGSAVLLVFVDVIGADDRSAPAALRITDAICHLQSVQTVSGSTVSD